MESRTVCCLRASVGVWTLHSSHVRLAVKHTLIFYLFWMYLYFKVRPITQGCDTVARLFIMPLWLQFTHSFLINSALAQGCAVICWNVFPLFQVKFYIVFLIYIFSKKQTHFVRTVPLHIVHFDGERINERSCPRFSAPTWRSSSASCMQRPSGQSRWLCPLPPCTMPRRGWMSARWVCSCPEEVKMHKHTFVPC